MLVPFSTVFFFFFSFRGGNFPLLDPQDNALPQACWKTPNPEAAARPLSHYGRLKSRCRQGQVPTPFPIHTRWRWIPAPNPALRMPPTVERKCGRPRLCPISIGQVRGPFSQFCSLLALCLPRQAALPCREGESRQTGRRVCWPLSIARLGGGGCSLGQGGWHISIAKAGGAVSLFREPSPLQVLRLGSARHDSACLAPASLAQPPQPPATLRRSGPAAAVAAASSATRQPWKT